MYVGLILEQPSNAQTKLMTEAIFSLSVWRDCSSCIETTVSSNRTTIQLWQIFATQEWGWRHSPFLFLNVSIVYLDAQMTHWNCICVLSIQNVRNVWCETQVNNDSPRGTLIWSMRHDPDIVVICHVAMSSPTSEHRVHLIQWFKASQWKIIRITSGFSDSVSTLRCFLWLQFQSIIIYLPPLLSLLFVLSLPDPGPSLQTMGFGIYDPVSNTYPESYPQKASLYLKLSLCSFTKLSEHSLKDLVLGHCNSLFLMFLMCIPRHLGGLFIFPFSCFWAFSPSPFLCVYMLSTCLKTDATSLIEIQPCWVDLIHLEPPIYNMFLTHFAFMFPINYMIWD